MSDPDLGAALVEQLGEGVLAFAVGERRVVHRLAFGEPVLVVRHGAVDEPRRIACPCSFTRMSASPSIRSSGGIITENGTTRRRRQIASSVPRTPREVVRDDHELVSRIELEPAPVHLSSGHGVTPGEVLHETLGEDGAGLELRADHEAPAAQDGEPSGAAGPASRRADLRAPCTRASRALPRSPG